MVFFEIIIISILSISFLYWLFIKYLTRGHWKDVEGFLKLVMGKPGSGKSTYMALLVRDAIKKGRPIYSNAHVLGALKVDHSDLGKYLFLNCDIIIDEAQLHYDSRDFKNFSEFNKFFFSHYRHFSCRVFILSQSFEDLDVKIRRQAQYIYICQPFIKGILLMEKIRMKFSVSEDETGIITLYKSNLFSLRFKLGFLAWKYFDSYSMPALPPMPNNDFWGNLPSSVLKHGSFHKYFKFLSKKHI